jgi:hypothetical protein
MLSCKLKRKEYDLMDVLVAKGLFLLVTIGALVVITRIEKQALFSKSKGIHFN